MIIKGHAPGTILQFLFIRERLRRKSKKPMKFIEVGSGKGFLSHLLLSEGHAGVGVDLNQSACAINQEVNEQHIVKGEYEIINSDFNIIDKTEFDFLIASMVIEHLNEYDLDQFIKKAKNIVKKDGFLIFLVPSNMMAWGIEDEIAGHVKRYSFRDIESLANDHQMKIEIKVGLNYPISNWLLNISNYIINKHEGHLISESEKIRTIYTGNRNVMYKTVFPKYLNIVLNEILLLPFHFIQKAFRNSEKCLVMYFEFTFD
jgi:2-polyprenyl-3-methyl-5-hydroxy-6-metoxy-1,4-benzoquinol methylase